jgi:hypothetical protein
VPFSSDSRGQFVIDLPEAVHGEVLVFASDGRSGSGAASLEIP